MPGSVGHVAPGLGLGAHQKFPNDFCNRNALCRMNLVLDKIPGHGLTLLLQTCGHLHNFCILFSAAFMFEDKRTARHSTNSFTSHPKDEAMVQCLDKDTLLQLGLEPTLC